MQRAKRIGVLLALAWIGACSSSGPKGGPLGPAPKSAGGFPTQKLRDSVFVSARYDSDAARIFGVNLVERDDVLPVVFTFAVSGPDANEHTIVLEEGRLDLRLILPDGTTLIPADPEEIAEDLREREAELVRQNKLSGGLLGTEKHEGYVFFEMKPAKSYRVDGRQIRHTSSGIEREFNLTHSLLSFNVSIDGKTRSMTVGLQ